MVWFLLMKIWKLYRRTSEECFFYKLIEISQFLSIGDGLLWKAEEDEIQMENLRRELQENEETIRALRAKLASMENEKNRTEREFDMFKQSLRIMNGSGMISFPVKSKSLKTKYGR